MKIIQKAYFLLAIIIAAASINLFLFVGTAQESTSDSKGIIASNDLKVATEKIARLANTIARGDESSRDLLVIRVNDFDTAFKTLKTGGKIHDSVVSAAPSQLRDKYNAIDSTWQMYKKMQKQFKLKQYLILKLGMH